jgi:Family of unknown function (DUF5343)
MATDLPYMSRVGNVSPILQKIRGAGTPPKFNIEFLKSSLGFTASQDRTFPRVLKQLGFLNADGTPVPRYNEFKSATTGGRALAQGLREGWAPIFLADQSAYTRTPGELKEIFKTVTGQGDAVATKMASTFKVLADNADWSASPDDANKNRQTPAEVETPDEIPDVHERPPASGVNLHHDVHVHLPPTSDVSVYRAIFRALREELL